MRAIIWTPEKPAARATPAELASRGLRLQNVEANRFLA